MVAHRYKIQYSKPAIKDAKKLKAAGYDKKINQLLEILRENPFQDYPSYEALQGNMKGLYSRRINIQHRLLYEVDKKNRTVKIFRMWTHYE